MDVGLVLVSLFGIGMLVLAGYLLFAEGEWGGAILLAIIGVAVLSMVGKA